MALYKQFELLFVYIYMYIGPDEWGNVKSDTFDMQCVGVSSLAPDPRCSDI